MGDCFACVILLEFNALFTGDVFGLFAIGCDVELICGVVSSLTLCV